jgi:hypothetical protein
MYDDSWMYEYSYVQRVRVSQIAARVTTCGNTKVTCRLFYNNSNILDKYYNTCR